MESEPKSGFAGLILAKVVCCAALVLAATGALGGIGGWFIDSGVIWLAGAFALAAAGIALVSTPALACRGTAEYPEAADDITQSTLTPERKNELLDQLNVGNALHKQAHRENDMMKMVDLIRILGGINAQIRK